MKSDKPQLITVLLDGNPVPEKYWGTDMAVSSEALREGWNKNGNILVHKPRMYEVLNLKQDYGRHTLTLQCNTGINAYVFTFGSEQQN